MLFTQREAVERKGTLVIDSQEGSDGVRGAVEETANEGDDDPFGGGDGTGDVDTPEEAVDGDGGPPGEAAHEGVFLEVAGGDFGVKVVVGEVVGCRALDGEEVAV